MRILFSPERSAAEPEELTIRKAGEVLTINGAPYDFSPLQNGNAVPAGRPFASDPKRVDGILEINLVLPIGADPSEAQAFPKPINNVQDGNVKVPT